MTSTDAAASSSEKAPVTNAPLRSTTSRGDWGESRQETVDVERARADFEEVIRTTSRGGRQQQQQQQSHKPSLLSRVTSRREKPSDEEDGEDDKKEVFDLRNFILSRQAQAEANGNSTQIKPVGVAWKDLAVYAPAGSGKGVFVKTLPVAIGNTAWRDPWTILQTLIPPLAKLGQPKDGQRASRPLIQGQLGLLRPSEMLLVLGRPGSGCTTTLRAITSNLAENVSHSGQLTYGGFGKDEIERKLRGEVIFIDEEDTHFPTLTVAQTLRFALRNKVPHKKVRPGNESRNEFIETLIDVLLKMVSWCIYAFYLRLYLLTKFASAVRHVARSRHDRR